LKDTAEAIERQTGTRSAIFVVDVGDADSVRRFAEAVPERIGPPHLLVNNAARLGPVGPITAADPADWVKTLTVNVGGVALMSAAVLSTMSGGGAIVNLSGGGIGGPGMTPSLTAYVASKAAVVALTEALADEFAPHGVTVNAIAPGPVTTRFMEPVIAAGPELGQLYETTQAQRQASTSLEPFVDLISYLVSPGGRWLSGCLLSARWDSVESLEARKEAILATSLLRLRRIDDALYQEKPS
jgi:NAD(P)-dependent dehydrogenase (short-subunit alcohol dehydrogenase family)